MLQVYEAEDTATLNCFLYCVTIHLIIIFTTIPFDFILKVLCRLTSHQHRLWSCGRTHAFRALRGSNSIVQSYRDSPCRFSRAWRRLFLNGSVLVSDARRRLFIAYILLSLKFMTEVFCFVEPFLSLVHDGGLLLLRSCIVSSDRNTHVLQSCISHSK